MKLFRKILFWCHLITGIAVAVVVLVMSITGVLLTYELQMTRWTDIRNLDGAPQAPDARRLGAGEFLAQLQESGQGRPSSIQWASSIEAPVTVSFGREKTLYANAYTGEILGGEGQGIRDFFHAVEDWHRWLAFTGEGRDTGKAITGASNLAFLFLVLSGLYLWWPQKWKRSTLRSIMWFRRGLSPKARDFNWHNVIGFWSFLPLVFIVGTAVVFSYPWANNLVFILSGESPPEGRGPRGGPPGGSGEAEEPAAAFAFDDLFYASLDGLIAPVEQRMENWRSLTLSVPNNAVDNLNIQVDTGTGRQPQKKGWLVVDRASGREVEWRGFEAGTRGSQARAIVRFLHTGEVLGFWGQALAGLVSLGSAFLVWTGLWLSWRRFRSWRSRQRRNGPASAEMPVSEKRRTTVIQ